MNGLFLYQTTGNHVSSIYVNAERELHLNEKFIPGYKQYGF